MMFPILFSRSSRNQTRDALNALLLVFVLVLWGCSPDEEQAGSTKSLMQQVSALHTQHDLIAGPLATLDTLHSTEQKKSTGSWTQSFDVFEDYASATILPLGNTRIQRNGTLEVLPIPTWSISGEKRDEDWSYRMQFHSYGRDQDSYAAGEAVQWSVENNRLTLHYADGLELYYDHTSRGLKQSLYLPTRTSGEGHVRVSFQVSGNTLLKPVSGQQRVDVYAGEAVVFSWSELKVYDAQNRVLPATMGVENDVLVIDFDDAHATYPVVVDPLASSPDWTLDGTQAGSNFGIAIAGRGNANADPYSDILIAEPNHTNNLPSQGRVLLFTGGPSGLSNTASWALAGDTSGQRLGSSIAFVPDVNGDGCSEVLVGTPGWSGAQGDSQGRVDLISIFDCDDPSTPLAPNTLWSATGETANSRFGGAVGFAGDVNCDGFPDIVVSAPEQPVDQLESYSGKVFVYYGLSGAPYFNANASDWSFESPSGSAQLGFSVAGLGNVNARVHTQTNRSCDDLLVGAPNHSNEFENQGIAYLFLGSENGLSSTPDWSVEGNEANAQLGFSVARAGDINGDGLFDILIGAPLANNGSGQVLVYYGDSTDTPQLHQILDGGQTGARFGFAVGSAGDVNQNGYSDVLIGAPRHSVSINKQEGRAFLFRGSPQGLESEPGWQGTSGQEHSRYGSAVASAGDIAHTGYEAILVGAFNYDGQVPNAGRVYLYPGQADCYIDGTYYKDGDRNPANDCQLCDPARSRTLWSMQSNGEVCDDRNACTENTICQQGVCMGPDVVCNDGNPCTINQCDPSTGCVFDAGAADGRACPSDGLHCTTNACSSGECIATAISEWCAIDETCYVTGTVNPLNDCEECNPGLNSTSWSPSPAQTPCSDGVYCTINNQCDGMGTCSSDGDLRPCPVPPCFQGAICSNEEARCIFLDPLEDNVFCDDNDACTTATTCQQGECVGTRKDCSALDEQCSVGQCNPNTGDCFSAPLLDGTLCASGSSCAGAATDVCRNGECVTCDDGNDCTSGSCDENSGQCIFSAVADDTPCGNLACTVQNTCIDGECQYNALTGFCVINGACYQHGDVNPLNRCQFCNAIASPYTWSFQPEQTLCLLDQCSSEGSELIRVGQCDDGGQCIATEVESCGEFLCIEGECLTHCESDDECSSQAVCNEDGICVSTHPRPIANAGQNQFVHAGTTATLDGSDSHDPEGNALVFSWRQIFGPAVALSDSSEMTPQFEVPQNALEGESFIFELIVSNEFMDSTPDTTQVIVTSTSNETPVAIIKGPHTAIAGDIVTLDGSDSFDPDGDMLVLYQWALLQGEPAPALLPASDDSLFRIQIPSHVPHDTSYMVRLVVNDGQTNSAPAEHIVNVAAGTSDDGNGDTGGDETDTKPDAGIGNDTGTDGDVDGDDGGDHGDTDLDEDMRPSDMQSFLEGSSCLCNSMNATPSRWPMHSVVIWFGAVGGLLLIRRRLKVVD